MRAIDVHAHLSTAEYAYEKRFGKPVAEALRI